MRHIGGNLIDQSRRIFGSTDTQCLFSQWCEMCEVDTNQTQNKCNKCYIYYKVYMYMLHKEAPSKNSPLLFGHCPNGN